MPTERALQASAPHFPSLLSSVSISPTSLGSRGSTRTAGTVEATATVGTQRYGHRLLVQTMASKMGRYQSRTRGDGLLGLVVRPLVSPFVCWALLSGRQCQSFTRSHLHTCIVYPRLLRPAPWPMVACALPSHVLDAQDRGSWTSGCQCLGLPS